MPRSNLGCQHSIAQHSTAQHSTARHSTAQHSTACIVKQSLGNVSVCPGLQGVKGVACIWRANDDFMDRFNLPLELPIDLVCY